MYEQNKHQEVCVPIENIFGKELEDFNDGKDIGEFFLNMENLDFAGKPGQRVKVVEGDFAGVDGTIKRVKKNKCVVVQIENVAAVAIAFLPAAFLLPLDEENK